MRILGIDFGVVRVGLAISDELGMLARELWVLSPKEFFSKLPELVETQEIERIIVGLPLGMSGQETRKTSEARNFAERIEKLTGLVVILFDERLSSKMAEKLHGYKLRAEGSGSRRGKVNIDSLAAQIILQNYLDSNRH